MGYAAVITHVQSDEQTAGRLACAVEVARRFNAALIGLAVEMIPPLTFDADGYSVEPDWVTAMREVIEDRTQRAHERFKAATSGLPSPTFWSHGLQLPAPAIAAASRAADLIVAGGAPRSQHDSYRDCSAAELAIISGRPVLVAPPVSRPLEAKHVVLAWKDTREARRALTDAIPFLERAESVVVAAICRPADAGDSKIEVDDVASALQRRGIAARAKIVEQAHPSGTHILDEARQAGADLIVCGAYGHSRLGEWIFGGVTADLLAQDEVYLLLSH